MLNTAYKYNFPGHVAFVISHFVFQIISNTKIIYIFLSLWYLRGILDDGKNTFYITPENEHKVSEFNFSYYVLGLG